MQGRLICGMAILSVLAPGEAIAAEIYSKRQGCRVEQSQQKPQQSQGQQQRGRTLDICREKRPIPPVVDPTPVFLL